jgi:hypothetical protein
MAPEAVAMALLDADVDAQAVAFFDCTKWWLTYNGIPHDEHDFSSIRVPALPEAVQPVPNTWCNLL